MKNILNVNKISLKPIFMSLAILFTAGFSFPNSFEKVVSASYSDDFKKSDDDDANAYNPTCRAYRGPNDPEFIKNYRKEEEEEANEISVYPLDKILIANCGEVTRESIKVENSRPEYEVEIEEEEEDMDDRSKFFVPEDNEYSDAQAKKAWKEFHNTLFGDSKSKINDLCPSIFSGCEVQ